MRVIEGAEGEQDRGFGLKRGCSFSKSSDFHSFSRTELQKRFTFFFQEQKTGIRLQDNASTKKTETTNN